MACRLQDNPTFTSSDGVPPELVVLGFQRIPARTGLTGRRHRSDRPAQSFVGVDRFDNRSRVLVHSSVLVRFCVNTRTGHMTAMTRYCPTDLDTVEWHYLVKFFGTPKFQV